MIAEGLLVEREALSVCRDRPPSRSARHRPSVEVLHRASRLSAEAATGVVTDLATRVIAATALPLHDSRPETVVRCARRGTAPYPEPGWIARVSAGIGLTLASVRVDAECGACAGRCKRFGWRDVLAAAMLCRRSSQRLVWVDNDANAFAVAQHLFGHARGLHSIAGRRLWEG